MSSKDKLEFVYLMGRYSNATVSDCQRLLRFASTLKRISDDDSKSAKKIRLQRRMLALCDSLDVTPRFTKDSVTLLTSQSGCDKIEVPA